MHFYEIVPVDHLLERLAEDRRCPAVCRALTELLLNSFFPQNSDNGADTDQLNRCVQVRYACLNVHVVDSFNE
jgi:hypothetical protein